MYLQMDAYLKHCRECVRKIQDDWPGRVENEINTAGTPEAKPSAVLVISRHLPESVLYFPYTTS